ncbi:HAD family hydrolase [Fictibacillus phosphorivorans]|uniref:HAD family hydrolase n=1 Tax=Fictibacillus phosphorivorans TaxID=1221500 RepID=UPI00203B045C|nr:HAD family hydrolase [Fictibacillus phosphorivorans]MCM3718322.1 HAD family hydrolase [Fictibacillus phosphorivorans]MCM3775814.1 HAD family hydrolase [Fictibacillus phosphorivorans]
MIKAVLFDLDGTLLDRETSVKKFIEDQHTRLSSVLSHIPKKVFADKFIELEQNGHVYKDKVYLKLAEELAVRRMPPGEMLDDYMTQFKHHCTPFPNLVSTLEELKKKGLKVGLVTNGYGVFQNDTIKALGIKEYFDDILISEMEGVRKPDPIVFERAAERLNVKTTECMFVGDHPKNDVEAARDTGMVAVWKTSPHWDKAEAAEYSIDDLSELKLIIETMEKAVQRSI